MAKLLCTGLTSLDGYINDEFGKFDWAQPDAEVHDFVNRLAEPVGTYLLGRKLYETLKVWDDPKTVAGEPAEMVDYARIWQAADKIVYSKTLKFVTTRRTRLETSLDLETLRSMKASATQALSIGGPTLAAAAISAGLVDEFQILASPVAVGSGTAFFPPRTQVALELVEERRFHNGVVFLRYLPRR